MTKTTENRLERLRQLMKNAELDTFMVLTTENRRYLSGFTGEDAQFDESAGALFITADTLLFATDSRFTEQAAMEAPLFEVFCYKTGLGKELNAILSRLDTRKLGYESKRLSCYQYNLMIETIKANNVSVELIPADDVLGSLRAVKEESEIDQIRDALTIAENAFINLKSTIRMGMAEKEIAWNLEKIIRSNGAEGLSFPSIIATGPNSALPHAIPGERTLTHDEPLLIDWGTVLNGYCSDITRTLYAGTPDEKFVSVFTTVLEAQKKAIQAIRSGQNGKDIDAVARSHIASGGYEEYFGHGLGHGVGLAVHEYPSLSPVRDTILKAGMVVTVEPGIYIPGWGGVRLENLVVVRDGGAEVLNAIGCEDYILES